MLNENLKDKQRIKCSLKNITQRKYFFQIRLVEKKIFFSLVLDKKKLKSSICFISKI